MAGYIIRYWYILVQNTIYIYFILSITIIKCSKQILIKLTLQITIKKERRKIN